MKLSPAMAVFIVDFTFITYSDGIFSLMNACKSTVMINAQG